LATERAEAQSIKQQQAVDSIHNDPTVEAIKKTFDAQVIESTIKPIN
jgi:DNA polymerase-3 subunit gamma/tau